jgi:hypothetical protein
MAESGDLGGTQAIAMFAELLLLNLSTCLPSAPVLAMLHYISGQ